MIFGTAEHPSLLWMLRKQIKKLLAGQEWEEVSSLWYQSRRVGNRLFDLFRRRDFSDVSEGCGNGAFTWVV